MDILGFAKSHLGEYRTRNTNEIVAKYCPFCRGGDKREQYSFALNISTQVYICHRASKCGAKGTFSHLCKLFGEKSDAQIEWEQKNPPKKDYKKPNGKPLSLDDDTIKYFAKRGIGIDALKKRAVRRSKTGNIMFGYKDDGEIVLIKYRTIPKDGSKSSHSCDLGGKPVLWGLDDCVTDKPLIIVEGEIDALTLDECGVPNVVSVPFGAGNTDEVITNQYDKLLAFPQIILWADNDKAGKAMVQKSAKRLGYSRCSYIQTQYKDANEMLQQAGKDAVIKAVSNPVDVEIENVFDLASIPPVDMSKTQTVKSGFKDIDCITGGFPLGCYSLVSGKTGSGKSTWINNIILSAVEQEYKSCVYSGELQTSMFQAWLELTLAGAKHVLAAHSSPNMPVCYHAPKNIQEKMRKWYRGKIFVYDNFLSAKPSAILSKFEEAYQRYNCQFFVIDNLMCLDFGSADDVVLNTQSKFASECVLFCSKYNAHIAILQHPTKTANKMQTNDIKGTGDIPNKASAIYLIHRSDTYTEIEITKNRIFGKTGSARLNFNERCKRFYDTPANLDRQYGFEDDEEEENAKWIKKANNNVVTTSGAIGSVYRQTSVGVQSSVV